MSYNGSGTFVINTAGQPVVSGTVISSTAFNALTADLATGLSTAITKDGQTTPTANIPMGNNKITGLAVGTAATDAANLSQVQSTAAKLVNSVSGADTITGTMSPNLGAYATGQMFYFVAVGANTGAVTINIDSLGAKSITRDGTTALAAGDIQSGEVCVIVYDGTQFQLVNGASQSASIVTENLTVNKATVLNESGGDNDTRIEGDTDANLVFVDASADKVGIGTSAVDGKLTIQEPSAGKGIVFLNSAANSGGQIGTTDEASTDNGLDINAFRSGGKIIFKTANTERMRLDSSGNLGLGVTPSAWTNTRAFDIGSFGAVSCDTATSGVLSFAYNCYAEGASTWKYKGAGAAGLYQATESHKWYTAASGTAGNAITFTTAMVLDASGQLGIGTTSPGALLHVYTSNQESVRFARNSTNSSAYVTFYANNSSSAQVQYAGILGDVASSTAGSHGGNLLFYTTGSGTSAERARITSGGAFLVGTTSSSNRIIYVKAVGNGGDYFGSFENDVSSNPLGIDIRYSAAAPNNAGNQFLDCRDSGTTRAQIRSNGGLANFQSNNADLSDARTKKDITPAASMWGKVAALEIVAYKYNDQTHDDVNLGVIAQQVEAVEPVWVDSDGWGGETPEDGVPLKTVYTKDITFAAIKALQEAMARIEQLEAKVAALEAK